MLVEKEEARKKAVDEKERLATELRKLEFCKQESEKLRLNFSPSTQDQGHGASAGEAVLVKDVRLSPTSLAHAQWSLW